MFFLGNASGHDLQPHVAGWIEAAAQWREGILFPRWAQWANSGFGEPRFIFYPPGSWMLGAALGSVLPWKVVPGAFVWLTLIIAGISMWKFAGQWLSPTQAIAAAIFFAANPYHLSVIYYRSAFAELLASALFPLMLLGTFGVLRQEWRRVPLLAFAFAAIWLSNAPAGVIAAYSLALILAVGCINGRSIRPLVLGGLSMLAGFGVAALYLIPAWWEQRWVQIAHVASTTYDPEKNFLFTRVNDPEFQLEDLCRGTRADAFHRRGRCAKLQTTSRMAKSLVDIGGTFSRLRDFDAAAQRLAVETSAEVTLPSISLAMAFSS